MDQFEIGDQVRISSMWPTLDGAKGRIANPNGKWQYDVKVPIKGKGEMTFLIHRDQLTKVRRSS